ncbi:unnamed protein product, partial [Closterium sp. NIES-54]
AGRAEPVRGGGEGVHCGATQGHRRRRLRATERGKRRKAADRQASRGRDGQW